MSFTVRHLNHNYRGFKIKCKRVETIQIIEFKNFLLHFFYENFPEI